MRKFIDTIPTDFEGSDVEVEGYNTIVELHNTQHETQRAALETFQTIAMAVIEMVSNDNARRADIDNRRLSLEEEKFNFEDFLWGKKNNWHIFKKNKMVYSIEDYYYEEETFYK